MSKKFTERKPKAACRGCPKKAYTFRECVEGQWRVGVMCSHEGECTKEAEPPERFNAIAAPGLWPQKSEAAGCHPDQVEEMTKAMADCGVPTEFEKDGDPYFRDKTHRKQALKVLGLKDKDACYRD